MPRRKPPIDRSQDDMVDNDAFRRALEQADAIPLDKQDIRPVSLEDADAALYGTRAPDASPEKKAFNALKMSALRDASTWTADDKIALMEHISLLRRWLDDLEEKANQ
jgi:hypothetical protein